MGDERGLVEKKERSRFPFVVLLRFPVIVSTDWPGTEITILTRDKSNGVVVLDKVVYNNAISWIC